MKNSTGNDVIARTAGALVACGFGFIGLALVIGVAVRVFLWAAGL